MKNRTPFPGVFWIANTIEILERFAYYGIYMGFGIYMSQLGYKRDDLGYVQQIFLSFSYLIHDLHVPHESCPVLSSQLISFA